VNRTAVLLCGNGHLKPAGGIYVFICSHFVKLIFPEVLNLARTFSKIVT